VTKLIVQQAHLFLRHATAERTLAAVHTKYWIPQGRASVSSIIKNCFDCKRFMAKPDIPLMSPLPVHRLQDDRPAFSNTGIDYFGPILTTVRRRREKRRGIIFTCLLSRAVHFEMAYSLDTSSFLLAFWRFARCRIRPDVVYSDNGTNLTAGEKELKAGLERLNQTIIAKELGAQTIEWIFPTPSAPHFGGAWERLIKTSRMHCFLFFKTTRSRTKFLSHP
jgi:Integrase zinc binding domain